MSSPGDPERATGAFRTMSLGGLLEAWDEPMPAGERELLLAELTRRGYRTKSLDAPPDPDGRDSTRSAQPAGASEVRSGALLVLLLGLGHLGFAAFEAYRTTEGGLQLEERVRVGSMLAIGGAFVALYYFARAAPRTALTTALALYVTLSGLELALGDRPLRFVLPILVTVALGSAALRAWRPAGAPAVDRDRHEPRP
jgi:hypothetical protein